ncbi:uncharacterized protein JCM6883_006688 [Sporobolomyces salmoneus]|uniref:uncharacterized protein n=1 Tax=Sporobolomyces salmoneus TaxID=183962 RepID=UPI00317F8D3D
MSNYKDYSQHAQVPRETQASHGEESGGNTRGMPGEKNYADLSASDLERAAKDNHDRPVGTFMGEYHVKGKEGPVEAYLEHGANPFAGEASHPLEENGRGDVGQAFGGYENEDGYYAEAAGRSSFGNEKRRHEDNGPRAGGYDPSRSNRQNAATTEMNYDPNDRSFTNDVTPRPTYPTQTFYRKCLLFGFQAASAAGTSAAFGLVVVLAIISHIYRKVSPFHKDPPRPPVEKDWEERISGERFSGRAKYYAEYFGYECEDLDVETEDGFVLRVHHLISKKHEKRGHPVILQHGILSNSVTYMVNEERSLAFWLLEQGYDVYLGNIRTNFKMPHRHFPRSDPRYWSWDVKDIGMYDVPAIVEFVLKETGIKPTWIGHSQGASTMFLALSRGIRPDIGNKISSFIALAPAVYAGPVLRKFPFSLMRRFKARTAWKIAFGVREFIPIISITQALLPSWLFGHLAAVVFAFIFGFHDHNWLKRQIPKYFRTVAVANSSELLYYMSVLSYDNCMFDTRSSEPWFPASFPPLAVFYGTLDTLVLGKPLVERIRSHEPNVRMIKAVALENYGISIRKHEEVFTDLQFLVVARRHQDPLWAYTAVQECYLGIRDVIEETKNGFAPVASSRRRQ